MKTLLIFLFALTATSAVYADWMIGPFERVDQVNPLIIPQSNTFFKCPLQNKKVQWESDHTFNPGAVVRKGKVYLIYRAEDHYGVGIGQHTSRLGLAQSSDGLHFKRKSHPVMFPDHDREESNEWPGGCEDPRIVEAEDGSYIMTYTQWNRQIPLLAVASSKNLRVWTKHGYIFNHLPPTLFPKRDCKSGSIICRLEKNRLIAAKIGGKYWMYWGEGHVFLATSDDLISWNPLLDEKGDLISVLQPREKKFDSGLVEAGPPAVITESGIVFLYNGKNALENGDPSIGPGAYAAGQALFDMNDPTKLLARTEESFFKPERDFEKQGQYQQGTVFIQGLVYFKDQWFLYYGTADSAIGVAVSK
jgi:beta-1,2-mannosidase